MRRKRLTMKIKRWISTGDLTGYIDDDKEVLEQMSAILDRGNVYASEVFGDIIFEGDDGKIYYAMLEGSLEEVEPDFVTNVLGYDIDEGSDEVTVGDETND